MPSIVLVRWSLAHDICLQNTHGEQSSENIQWFRGERRRGKTDFSMKMYADEVQV